MSESAFLAQLDAHPDDDVTRLVYADWLDERDDPRGEFLRAAVALRGDHSVTTRAARRPRLLELRSAIPTGWLARVLREFATDDVREAVFRHACAAGGFSRDAFLTVEGGDPSWYLLDRLRPDYPDLWPDSKGRKGRRYLPGARYAIRRVRWHDRERCDVDFDAVLAPLAGNGMLYGVELQEGRWTITSERETWFS